MLTPFNRNYNPYRDFRRMMNAVDRELFGEEYENLENHPFALDVSSDDDQVIVRAALPGMKEDDIDIEINGDVLTIRGETQSEYDESTEHFTHREMRYGKFSRSIRLADDVKVEEAEAALEDGILTVRLPKDETSSKRKIAVKDSKLLTPDSA